MQVDVFFSVDPLGAWIRLNIFLIEDNPGDVRLMSEGLRALDPRAQLVVAADGEEALHYFARGGTADLIILDINLPKVDGLELLRSLKRIPEIELTPVIVLSSSTNPAEIRKAYSLGANAYVSKPISNYFDMLGDLHRFWMRRAILPSKGTGSR